MFHSHYTCTPGIDIAPPLVSFPGFTKAWSQATDCLVTSKLRFALSLILDSTGESTGVWSVNLVSKLLTSSTPFWMTQGRQPVNTTKSLRGYSLSYSPSQTAYPGEGESRKISWLCSQQTRNRVRQSKFRSVSYLVTVLHVLLLQ